MTSFKFKDESVCQFQFWAPKAKSLTVVPVDAQSVVLQPEQGQKFTGDLETESRPLRYRLKTGSGAECSDPRSVYLPEGVHGPSEITNKRFTWSDDGWRGHATSELIIYELHIGTFSPDGTFGGCLERLDYLCDLGVNAIEFLPLAQCPGRWNWGYDSVGLWAVNCNYGRPEDLKALVDACHERGISVIHDVVYNHVGPEGNYLNVLGDYFSKTHQTPWGSAFDFDGPNREQAREFVVANALYWLHEFHFDGLRLDAVHYMFDNSSYSILQEICDQVREYESTLNRPIHLIGEANIYDHDLIVNDDPKKNRYSAIWADDLMHSIYSVGGVGQHLTAREYRGASDLDEVLRYGYLYQGPVMKRASQADRQATHGDSFGTQPEYLESLIMALQTHDSVGNDAEGRRLNQLTSVSFQMAAAPLILLYPAIPMIFMGEEFAADSPFMFFADFIDPKLRKAVDRGRKKEFPNHDWSRAIMPSDDRAFVECKIEIPKSDNSMLDWYRQLIQLRKSWKQMQLIAPARLNVYTNLEQRLFGFTYAGDDAESSGFVISRLSAQFDSDDGVSLPIGDGKLVLDSHRCQHSPTTNEFGEICLRVNQAVVGFGQPDFSRIVNPD